MINGYIPTSNIYWKLMGKTIIFRGKYIWKRAVWTCPEAQNRTNIHKQNNDFERQTGHRFIYFAQHFDRSSIEALQMEVAMENFNF